MYLYVTFVDTHKAWEEAMMGLPTINNVRVKRIKLTEEQIAELQPRFTGMSGGKEAFETVNVISVQEE